MSEQPVLFDQAPERQVPGKSPERRKPRGPLISSRGPTSKLRPPPPSPPVKSPRHARTVQAPSGGNAVSGS